MGADPDAEAPWPDKPSELLRHWDSFVPTFGAGPAHNLNAVTRLAIIYAAVMSLVRMNMAYIAVPVAVGCATWLAHFSGSSARREGLEARRSLGSGCREPTADNPYMNAIHTYDPKSAGGCDPLLDEVQRGVVSAAGSSRFPSPNDLWGDRHSHLRFMTNPSTVVPNDRKAFEEFLYGGMRTTGGKKTRL